MSFDRLAPHYAWMEAVLAGRRLQHGRTAWLDALQGCGQVLIAGVGHGRFLRAAARQFPGARFTCVDASNGMLRHAQRRALRAGIRSRQMEFVHAALPAWVPTREGYDAIVTHFFLDCFPAPELAAVVARLAEAARPRAKWLLTDFALPERGLARHRGRVVHALMYAFFRGATGLRAKKLTPPDALLAQHGFALAGRRPSEWGLLHADLWIRDACPTA